VCCVEDSIKKSIVSSHIEVSKQMTWIRQSIQRNEKKMKDRNPEILNGTQKKLLSLKTKK